MADFPSFRHSETGATMYVTIRNAAGHYWDTVAGSFDNPMVPAQWANYDIAANEDVAGSYQYHAEVPVTLDAGVYFVDLYKGSTAITDWLVATAEFYWNGSAIVANPTNIAAILADTGTDGVVLAADAITAAKIADDAFSAEHFATNSISADALKADAVLEIADGVWDEVLGHTTTGTTGLALGTLIGGVGSTSETYTVTDGTDPLANVEITVTTDAAGDEPIAHGYSDSSGEFTFFHDLASGTPLYIFRFNPGYSFTNPDTEAAT